MVPRYFAYLKKLTVAAAGLMIFDLPAKAAEPPSPLRKIEDRIIYQDADFYSAFPSIVRRRDGELIVAFRRAPNRGAMCEGRDGRVYWVVAANSSVQPRRSETHLLVSSDRGRNWEYSCLVASDTQVSFNETSLYETPRGDLVAFMRTANFDDHTVIARSTDRGRSFQPWKDAGFQGHPHHALRLPDQRVLLVYGYRHRPYGIRARLLDPECTQAAAAAAFVLRDDGGSSDLGYPWATRLSGNRLLVV